MKFEKIYNEKVNETLYYAKHESGLMVYAMPKEGFSKSYAVFGTKFGSIDSKFKLKNEAEFYEVPDGVAHFLEHKMFEQPDGGNVFESYARHGANANAYTSFNLTAYLFEATSDLYDNLEILLSFVQEPYFTKENVDKEQGIIGQEIRMYDDEGSWQVSINLLKALYHNNPVRIDIAGTVESIAQIDDQLLYKCYNTFYNPSNMFICIAGNVDAERVLKQIKDSVKPKDSIEIERINEEEPEEVVKPYVSQKLAVAQPIFCLGYKEKIETPERTLKEKVTTALLIEILAGDASPLYKKLITEGLINDEFSSEYFNGNGYAAVIFEGESNDPERVAEEIKAEVERVKAEGIDKKLFSAIRCGMYGNAIRMFDSVEGIAMQFVDCAVCDTGLFDEIKYLRSVTVDDVYRRLLKLDGENTVLSVIKPMEEA